MTRRRQGDDYFVTTVLKEAGEQLERRYYLKAKGYDFEAVVKRVAELLEMKLNRVVTYSKNSRSVKARSLVCYWSYCELGMSQTDLAQKLGIFQPDVSSAVRKGKKIAIPEGYELIDNNKL